MKFFINISLILLSISALSQSDNVYFTLKPTLTPNASQVIFSFEGDLWKVSASGGNAYRITAMRGVETDPSVSPDGKWLAFSSNQYGNSDVYIMSIKGGEITQLTFHQSNDNVVSWSWDSSKIHFTSNRYNRMTDYSVDRKGGTPVRTFDHYFNTVHNVVEHPLTHDLYFNESMESAFFAHRKRYKGDYNPDIKSYNKKLKEFTKHTSYRGKDFAPTIDKDGNIYFKSDEANGEYNLYRLNNGNKKQLTSFSTSIMWPKVSANGKKIVFRKDYQIYLYDVTSGKTTKIKISINQNSTLNKDKSFDVKGEITFFDVSPDGKKMAFVSRGRLFVSDVKGKFINNIMTNPMEAVREVKWLKDNKSLLFSQSVAGYYNWYTIAADGSTKEKQRTNISKNNRQITLNLDRTQGVYYRGRDEICTIDLMTFKSEVIINDEFWAIYNTTLHFSPNGKYLLYNAKRDFETDVFVYNIGTKKVLNLTKTKVSESEPIWSLDGKYIYFSSNRIAPSFPRGSNDTKIYQMALDKYEKPFRLNKFNSLFEEKEKDSSENKSKKNNVNVFINTENLMKRLTPISPKFGSQSNISIIKEDDKTHILYISDHSEGKRQLWKTTLEPFEKNKIERVSDKKIDGYQLVSIEKKNYILTDGVINTIDIGSNKIEVIKMNYNFNKSLDEEFIQMYYEAWAGMEENFYDENFHGQNWQNLRDRYAKYLPFVSNRSNLRLIFNDMLGELNTSHFGFNSNGKEEELYYGTRSLATGIVFNNKDAYIVDRIVSSGPMDITGKNIKKGDQLVAVNGINVDTNKNRESYFSNPVSIDEMTMTFKRENENIKVNVHPTSYNSIRNLIYDEWQESNQKYVDKKSNSKIAYVHMKNMSGGELIKFKKNLVSDEGYKDGLILDLRYNTGGNVHDDVLKFLSQKKYLNWKYREGKLTGQSNFNYGNKPIVLLINEQSLSDAEMTAAGFKELGLGTIVGTETYRWIIFTTGRGLVDGSFYRLPTWGCYTLSGGDLEIEGVAPDVYIAKSFEDRLNGKSPQLDKAIEIILSKISK